MRKYEIIELIKKAEESPLWILEGRINHQNKILMELKGQGVSSSNTKFRKTIAKRNIYRKVVFKKLEQFLKGELKSESNPDYSDYVHSSNYNREGENDELIKSNGGQNGN
jgi:hypothetical protein